MPDLLPAPFGDLLKAARKRQKLTQRQLAQRVGVHVNTLWAWERGDYLPAMRSLVLELARQLQLSDAETRQFLEASLTALSPYWTVPFPRNPCFTGRETLLEQLHRCLSAERSIALTQSYALSGLGGIGKTQLALEYAYRHALDYHAIFWLAAETTETLLASLQQVAELLGLPARQEAEQMRLVTEARRWLSTHKGWLLIADNVDDVEGLQSLLPPARQGAILLTTRLQALSAVAEGLEVPPMSAEEGRLLVLRRAKRLRFLGIARGQSEVAALPPDEAGAAISLVALLEGLPLALDQAGAYIEESGCSIADYLQRYQESRQPLLARRGITAAHPASVAATVRLAIEQVERLDAAAADVLRVCAFLQPEAIPEELLMKGAPFLGPVLGPVAAAPVQLDQALAALRRFSLVSRHAETHTLSVHRLVQAVVQDELDPATRRMWDERVLRAVNATLPQVDFATRAESERYLSHALSCVARLEQEGAALPEATEVLFKTGSYLLERGRYGEAEPLLVQAVASGEAQHGTDHPLLIPFLVRLGALWHKRGNYDLAQATLRRALALAEQRLSPAHPQKAQVLSELGNLYWSQGRDAEAEHVGQQALSICEQHWGPDHPQTATALANLASYWQEQGRYAEAEPLFVRALAICEQHLGVGHSQTADTLNSLTLLHLDQGNAEQAILVGARALAIFEEQMGPEHPKTAMALNNLALAYRRQGRHAEALPLYQRALSIAEQQLGREHPHTALAINNLATVYREQGRYTEAEACYQQALVIQSRQLGPEHPQLGYTLNNLALLHQATGEYEQAEAAGEQALRLREQQLGNDHPLTATSLATLASAYRAQGKLEQARPLYRRALVICEQRLGPNHPSTLQARKDTVSVEGGQAALAPQECSVLSASIDECSVLGASLGTSATTQTSQISSLVLVFAHVPDRRSDQGQRHPLAAVLALVTAAQLSGTKTLRAIARWGQNQPPEVVRALGFRGTRTPAVSTLHDVLKTLDGVAFEQALDAWVQQILRNERSTSGCQDQPGNDLSDNGLPGMRVIARYPSETRHVLLHYALSSGPPPA